MYEAFHLGGWGMYPTTVFGILWIGAALRYAVGPEKRFVPLQISLGIMTLLAGTLGFVTGLITSLVHLGEVGPDEKWISLIGLGESLVNIAHALALGVVATLAASVGALRLARGLRSEGTASAHS